MISGLLKSYFMRIKLWLDPIRGVASYLLSIVNMLLSFFVVASLVYAFGFRVSYEEAISLMLFKIAFFSFYVEHCVIFLPDVVNRKFTKSWYFSVTIFVLMSVILILWALPQTVVEKSVFLQYVCHDYSTMVLVSIQAIMKFSAMLTASLSNRLSPNWIFVGSFVLLIMVGTGLLLLPRATYIPITLLDSLFTTVSAVCVTGLSVVDVSATFTKVGQVILLLLIQLGGIGIMTFTSFFGLMYAGKHSSRNKLLIKDLIDPDKGVSQIFATLRNILFLTFLIEGLGAWCIYHSVADYSWNGIFIAVFHSVSAFCNAGFSNVPNGLYNEALRDNYFVLNTVSLLIILGGLGFPILFNIWGVLKVYVHKLMCKVFGRWHSFVNMPRVLTSNSVIVLVVTLFLLVSGTIVFFITEYNNILVQKSFWGKLSTAFFLSVTPRTAGFNAFDMTQLMPITITYMIVYMWVGGSPMSTAGGIKTTTLGIALLNVWNTLRGREHIEIRHRSLAHQTVNRAFIVMFVSLVVIAVGICLISAFEPQLSMQAIAFEVVSAFSTVGLSLDVTPTLSIYSKVVLIIIMFIGRMGLLTLLSCFIPESESKFYNYPTENIPVS